MYHSDKPIESSENDLLGRAQFSKQLAQSLLKLDSSESFTVGIYGKWGTGKTSVLNMVQKEIELLSENTPEDEKPLIMRFEPWNYSDCNQLLQQFFAQLSSSISLKSNDELLRGVGEKLERYAASFDLLQYIPSVGKYLSIIPEIVKTMGGNFKDASESRLNDVSVQKETLINELKKQNHRIIIFIDDIDRLSNDQIRLIFQLVCSVAGFPNVIYVLSFDKRIVTNALNKVQNCDGNEYLEKIIQIPFDLPEIDETKVHDVLFGHLDKLIEKYNIKKIDQAYWSKVFRTCVQPYIHTLRDVIRVTNVLGLKLSLLGNEVNFCDLVAICVFQATAPQIMTYIQQNKNSLVGSKNPFDSLISWGKTEKGKEDYLKEFSEIEGIHAEELLESLSTLFPQFAHKVHSICECKSDADLRREKRLAHIDKYDLYMSLSLEELSITDSVIQQTINTMPEKELVDFLYQVNDNGHAVDYLLELESNVEIIPIERVPLFVRVLIEYAYVLTGEHGVFITAVSATHYAEHLAEKLLLRISDKEDRSKLLTDILDKCSLLGMQSFSTILNTFELSYGRLAANGEEQGEKVISLTSLEMLEIAFVNKMKSLFIDERMNVLDQPNSRMLCYLWEQYDKDTYSRTLYSLLQSPDNICRFMFLSSAKWTGSGTNWTFSDDYSSYVSKEQVLESIEKVIHDPIFIALSQDLKEVMAAFVLWNKNEYANEDERALFVHVQELLNKWEKNVQE